MSPSRIVRIAAVVVASLGPLGGAARAQPAGGQPAGAVGGETLQRINDDYNRQLLQIERQRLERLDRLAAVQPPREAAEAYEMLFRLAIANNLFAEADPAADRILKAPATPSPAVRFLAEMINLIASADRGHYDESLADLRRLVGVAARRGAAEAPAALLDTPSLLIICGAYYHRVIQGERFDVARRAFQLLAEEAGNPDVKEYARHRLRQLALIGRPAPPIRGTDVDGRPFDLAGLKGDVVLVVFWATWCVPNAAEVAWLDEVYGANRAKGFRIVGINLDTLQNGGSRPAAVLPGVRRFLLDHNVRWPNLIDGAGPSDVAAAYGVTEIPTNILIGRDGKVMHLDLTRKNLAEVVARAVGR